MDLLLKCCKSIALFDSKAVAALIFGVTGVSLYPVEGNVVLFEKRQELFPQIDVKGRLFVGFYPAFLLPAVNPAFGDTVNDIFAVCGQYDLAGFLECFKSGYDTEQLHTVVSGGFISAGEFFFDIAEAQDYAIAAGTGVSAASAVGKYLNSFNDSHSNLIV